MGEKTGISWTDSTWNPIVGCTRVSAGCDNCYAVRATRRLAGKLPLYQGLVNPGKSHFNGVVRTVPERLDQPLRWKRPRRIFVNSMSDLFHPEVPDRFIAEVWAVMSMSPQHTFQILTKRPDRMRIVGLAMFRLMVNAARLQCGVSVLPDSRRADGTYAWPLPNVWLGTSIEDQQLVEERCLPLFETPARIRFLSLEPLLGPINLGLLGTLPRMRFSGYQLAADRLDWVIVGGESGPGHRPIEADWVRAIRDECHDAKVAFFFKQWGGRTAKAGGRELDGRVYDEWPS